MKPVEENELVLDVRKVLEKRSGAKVTSDTISVFDGTEYSIRNQKDILYLKADGSYIKFVLHEPEVFASKRSRDF
tara:strand:- start:1565 stop:1789 length:225 start_codon:yes stop_codon:yes gene_type:complete